MQKDYNFSASEFREKIRADLKLKASDSVILMCAILIASIGLNMNSIPVIIGAMLISPLMTPLLGIGYGLSTFDSSTLRKALSLLGVEVFFSLIVSSLYFAISPITYASSEIIARTYPTIWDVIIAFAGGLAGIIGARQKGSNNIVPGVAIATALMPPVCTIGYSIATRNLSYFLGSSYLFIINCAFIVTATFIGVRFMRFPLHQKISADENKKLTKLLVIISLLIVIPSVFSASNLVQESIRTTAINQLIDNDFSDYIVLNQKYNEDKKSLTLTVSGERLSKKEISKIENDLPEFGLKDTKLTIKQLPNLNELDSRDATKYIDQYIDNKLEKETNKQTKNSDSDKKDTKK
ncbi:membrane protein [Companilactobacillus sp. RD055328]|uniref:DUF389 domain-containing protein n=1 Tax=Companilactobacillus sp. RD055328 TaxID=2916634 RepID=UPI001FC7C293|nr:DUF389 domain-containing protein [Companilactobacillus sp. RD055328]GKQ43430.1 membrane protein [Companilactobacillus sp. RD055328]